MSKTGFILLCLLFPILLSASQIRSAQSDETARDAQLRDSVFRTLESITTDEARVDYLHKILRQNSSKDWMIELLDSALALAVKIEYVKGEIDIRYDYYGFYKFRADTAQMQRTFFELKAASTKHKDFDNYFDAWGDILQFRTLRGDTEYVLMEAKRMGQEARALNNQRGIYNSMLTEARALKTSESNEQAIEKYRETLKLPFLMKIDKAIIHNEIAQTYQVLTEYEKAISELEKQRILVEQALKENPEKGYRYECRMLDVELAFCENYLAIAQTDKLKQHLDMAAKYYTSECLFSYNISYHVMWAGYYYLVDRWDDCFREFDIALSHFNGTQPLYEMSVRLMKGQALEYAERYKEAAENYRRGAFEMDSLNRDVLRLHQEAHRANFTIRQALLDKAIAENRYNLLLSVMIVMLFVALLTLLTRALYVRRELLRSERQTRQALEMIEAANKMKEVFLQNITFQIRVPLNLVVGFADVLTSEKELPAEQMHEYAAMVKKSAEHLSKLIFDILDLSRLESGMMKFNIERCDAVQLCRDAKMMVEMEGGNVQFDTELTTLPIQADSARFMKMLVSVLSPDKDKDEGTEASPVEFVMIRETDKLKITVKGSPLLHSFAEVNQNNDPNHILHDINRLYLDTFNGSYSIMEMGDKHLIVITYPTEKTN